MPLILGTNSIKDLTYNVANSCRFNSADSPKLSKTISDGHDTDATFSCWFKRSRTGEAQTLFEVFEDSSNFFRVRIEADDVLQVRDMESAANQTRLKTTQVFRDVTAWTNLVVIINTSNGTADDRCKIFINGTRVDSFGTQVNYDQNDVTQAGVNGSSAMLGGAGANNNYLDGYIAEAVFLDGTAQDVSGFGEFDEDSPTIWKPKNPSSLSGSKGTNGFYLDFESSSNLGNDVFGGTDLTETNIVALDQSSDTCTLNMTTLNPLHFNATIPSANTLTEGNLVFTSSQGGSLYPAMYSTLAVTQGKWYAEFKVTTGNSAIVGIGAGSLRGGFFGGGLYDYGYYFDGTFYNSGGNTGSQSSFTDGDIISVAMDLDNYKIYVAKNNVYQHSGNPSAGSGGFTITAPSAQTDPTGTGLYHFAAGDAGGGTPAIQCNFGSPSYSSNGNTDAEGFGNMTYSVPTGFFILNSTNLAEYG